MGNQRLSGAQREALQNAVVLMAFPPFVTMTAYMWGVLESRLIFWLTPWPHRTKVLERACKLL